MMRTRSLSPFSLPLVLGLAACAAGTGSPEAEPRNFTVSPISMPLVVNECQTGSAGIHRALHNSGSVAIDVTTNDPSWRYVDDINVAESTERRLTIRRVSHAATSTTRAAAGRSATCGLARSGPARVRVPYAYVNATTADQCRLLATTKSGGTCGTLFDEGPLTATQSTSAGQCFCCMTVWLRVPPHRSRVQGTSNGAGHAPGSACNDGNACTTVGPTPQRAFAFTSPFWGFRILYSRFVGVTTVLTLYSPSSPHPRRGHHPLCVCQQ